MALWQYTLTVDASVARSRGERLVGIGILIQERIGGRGRGPIIDQIAELHRAVRTREAEEFAVLRALEIAAERGYSRLKVRSDYNQMRTRLHDMRRGRKATATASPLQARILELAKGFEFVHFAWVPRRKNQHAHALSRQGWRDPDGRTVVLASPDGSTTGSG